MRKRNPQRVLGIDPGSRFLGTATLDGRELAQHGVFEIGRASVASTLSRARKETTRLIDAYHPSTLAIEKTFFGKGRHAPLLALVAEEIRATAAAHGLSVYAVAPSSLKKAITGNGHASKQEVARVVCAQFPELRAFLGVRRKWQARFHFNMFDAVALAMLVVDEQDGGAERG